MAGSHLRISRHDGVSIVHLPEELVTTGIVVSFRDAWLEIVDDGHLNFIVDFDNVRRFGSEATGVLVRVAQRLRTRGGDMKLCSMSENVKEIFTICHLIPTMFKLYDTAASALDACRDEK